MLTATRPRIFAMLVIVVLIGLLGVWIGAIEPDPADNRYPGAEQIAAGDIDDGALVTVSGTVISTDPYTIEVRTGSDTTMHLEIRGIETEAKAGDRLTVHGQLTDAYTIDSIDTIHREPWERQYMYGISLIAGLWVLGRFVTGWRINTKERGFVPREEPWWSSRG